jgi:hypothetical protein
MCCIAWAADDVTRSHGISITVVPPFSAVERASGAIA